MIVKQTNLKYRVGQEYDDDWYVLKVEKSNARWFKWKITLTQERPLEKNWVKDMFRSIRDLVLGCLN